MSTNGQHDGLQPAITSQVRDHDKVMEPDKVNGHLRGSTGNLGLANELSASVDVGAAYLWASVSESFLLGGTRS
jgi:hypothetical protein